MIDFTLIFDVGANNGDDTAFYLAKGFKVVSIDADSTLCSQMKERFEKEIAAGRCSIVNSGIGDSHATKTFYRNPHKDWSSFLKNSKATSGGQFDAVNVDIRPLSEILSEHGLPYYMKLDIEGYELPALHGADLVKFKPPHLSFEINFDWKEILDLLASHGYHRFQLIRQGRQHFPVLPQPAREGMTVEYPFNDRMSGPFGRDLPEDRWFGLDEIRALVTVELGLRQERIARGERPGWHDIHCAA